MAEKDTESELRAFLMHIDVKLDGVAKLRTDLARFEERIITLFKTLEALSADHKELEKRLEENHKALDKRVTALELVSSGRGKLLGRVERLVWLVIASAVAGYVGLKSKGQ